MAIAQRPDAIDLSFVFRAYAWLAIATGLVAYGWGNLFTSTYDLPAVPFGRISLVRMTGAIAVTLGCCALGFRLIPDEVARRRSLMRFATAHLVFGVLFFGQWVAIWDGVLPPILASTPLFIGVALLYIAYFSASSLPWAMATLTDAQSGRELTLVDRPGVLATIRSQYEEQIAEAARQEERARLARDLHDAVKQQLFVIQTAAATAEARWESDVAGARAAVERVRTSTREAIVEMEAMLEQLQAAPIGHAGLATAVRHQAEALAFRTGAQVSVDVGSLPPESALLPATPPALCRIAQEALSNVGRHARATTVRVRLVTEGGAVVLSVEDNGAGFDPVDARAGQGLRNMRERAAEIGGRFAVVSAPSRGTLIRVTIPCESRDGHVFVWRALVWFAVGAAAAIAEAWLGPVRGGWAPLIVLFAAIEFVRHAVAAYRIRRKAAAISPA